ncbi:PA3496 family putative envelope integrity protein [Kaarinaea lacus]
MEWLSFDFEDEADQGENELDLDSQPNSIVSKRRYNDPRRLIEIMQEQKLLREQLGEITE